MARKTNSTSGFLKAANVTIPQAAGTTAVTFFASFNPVDGGNHLVWDIRDSGTTYAFNCGFEPDLKLRVGWYIAGSDHRVVITTFTVVPGYNTLVLTYDNTANESKVYLNGSLIGSQTSTLTTVDTSAENFYIGNYRGENLSAVGGYSRFVIASEVWDAGEIAAYHASGAVGGSVVHHWEMADNSLLPTTGGITLTESDTDEFPDPGYDFETIKNALLDYNPIVLFPFQEFGLPVDYGSIGLTLTNNATSSGQAPFLSKDVYGRSSFIAGSSNGLQADNAFPTLSTASFVFPFLISSINTNGVIFSSYNMGAGFGGFTITIYRIAASTNFTIDASTHTLTRSSGDFLSFVAAGWQLLLSGFSNPSNNGIVTVVSVTTSTLVYTTDRVDVDEGPVAATVNMNYLLIGLGDYSAIGAGQVYLQEGSSYVVGVTWDGPNGNADIYLDGEHLQTGTFTPGTSLHGTKFIFGAGIGLGWYLNSLASYYMICDTVLDSTDMADIYALMVNLVADTYTRTVDNVNTAGYPVGVTVTPNGRYTGTITITPDGCGVSIPITLTFDDSSDVQSATFYPVTAGELAFSFTNSETLTDPGDVTHTIVAVDALITFVEAYYKRIDSDYAISVLVSHPSAIVSVTLSNDEGYSNEQTVETLNTYLSNTSDTGVKYSGVMGYTFPISPDDFTSSGVKVITATVIAVDGSETVSSFVIKINKGGIVDRIGYLSGLTGSSGNNGLTAGTAKDTYWHASTIYSPPQDVIIYVGPAADYTGYVWTDGGMTHNTDGYTYFRLLEGTTREEAAFGSTAANGLSDGTPHLSWFEGIQFGTGDPAVASMVILLGDNQTQFWVFDKCLFQGPLEGAPYYGLNWTNSFFGSISGASYYIAYFNSSFIGLGGTKAASLVLGCFTQHGIWGYNGGAFVYSEVQHVQRPEPADTMPTPGGDVHPDIYFQYGGVPNAYFDNYYCIIGPWGTRGIKADGDGPVTVHFGMRRCYVGSFSEQMGNGGLSLATDITVLREVVHTGSYAWTPTGRPLRCHDVILRSGSAEPTEVAFSYCTYTPGGKHLFPTCWPNGTVTSEMPKSPSADLVILDTSKFSLSETTAEIIDATYYQGQWRFTLSGTVYGHQTPILHVAEGAYTVGGVGNSEQHVTFDRNYAAGLTPEPDAPYDLVVTTTSPTEMFLSWNQVGTLGFGVVGWRIYFNLVDDFNTATATPDIPYTDGSEAVGTVTDLEGGTEYFFWVVAYNSSGDSEPSDSESGTPEAASTGAPEAPTLLSYSELTQSSVLIEWVDNSSGESQEGQFDLVRATNSGFTQNVVTVHPGQDETTYPVTGLSSGTRYYFKIRATNSEGTSSYTSTLIVDTFSVPVLNSTATNITVTGTTTQLLAGLTGGDSPISYDWSSTVHPEGSNLQFSNAAVANPTITFDKAGEYTFSLTVVTVNDLSDEDTVEITVEATPTEIQIADGPSVLLIGEERTFQGTVFDQFDDETDSAIVWSVSDGTGTIDPDSGLYTTRATHGTDTIRATVGDAYEEVQVEVFLQSDQVTQQNSRSVRLVVLKGPGQSRRLRKYISTGEVLYLIGERGPKVKLRDLHGIVVWISLHDYRVYYNPVDLG